MGNCIDLGLESVLAVDLLLLELFRKLLFDYVLIVEALDSLSFVLDSSLRVGRAYHLARQIDLRLKAMLCLLSVLTPQLFPLLCLSC